MAPSQTIQRLNIFISSPGDVGPEREAAKRAIMRLSELRFLQSKYDFKVLTYESEVPPKAGAPAQMVVNRYMGKPEDCYLLVCIFWTRMGTEFTEPETQKRFESGTEYEFTLAYEANRKRQYPHVLLYRKTAPNPSVDADQKKRVDKFFGRFHAQNGRAPEFEGLYQNFIDTTDFENLLYKQIEQLLSEKPPVNSTVRLQQIALEIDQLTRKKTALKEEVGKLKNRLGRAERDAEIEGEAQRDSSNSRLMPLIGVTLVILITLGLALAVNPLVGGIVGVLLLIGLMVFISRLSNRDTSPPANPEIEDLRRKLKDKEQAMRNIERDIEVLNREAQTLK